MSSGGALVRCHVGISATANRELSLARLDLGVSKQRQRNLPASRVRMDRRRALRPWGKRVCCLEGRTCSPPLTTIGLQKVNIASNSNPRADVAVIIPCYNYGRYLHDCVKSIIESTRLNVQVLVIDDCSSDDTQNVCSALLQKYQNIRVVRNDPNQGHISTYNHGLRLAQADFIHLISADDQLAPFALDRAVSIMRRHSNVGMVYGRVHVGESANFSQSNTHANAKYSIVSGADWIDARFSDGRNPIYSPEVTLRSTVAADVGIYDHRLPRTADLEMWLRISARSDVAVVDNVVQAFYRMHPNNMHKAHGKEGLLTGLRERSATYDFFLEKDGTLLDDPVNLLVLARAKVAHDALYRASRLFDAGDMTSLDLDSVLEFANSIDSASNGSAEWKMIRRRILSPHSRGGLSTWLMGLWARCVEWRRWKALQRDLGHSGINALFVGQLP